MRSPRLIYGLVAGVLVVAGFVLPRYLAGRSQPELGDTVVVPAATSPSTPPPTVNPRPTAPPPSVTPGQGAEQVSPAPARTAGDDDDDDLGDDPDDDDG
ncbi:hypothetical protein [Kribbella sp. NPDC049227]|uniref:hypothetical protein n=1 Tax=Kribbella sp. NPDC049227 TaxID=3364113 RepID=UPI0037137FC9